MKKLNNSLQGLDNHVNALSNSLKNPNLTDEARKILQKAVDKGEDMISKIKEVVKQGSEQLTSPK